MSVCVIEICICSPQQLQAKYDSVEQIEYAIEEPIAIVFDAIEDLQEIAELAGKPFSPEKNVDLGYMVVSTNRIFRSDVRKWTRRPEYEKYG